MKSIESIFKEELYIHPWFNWVLGLLFIIGAVFFSRFVYWFLGKVIYKLTQKTKSKVDDIILIACKEPLVYIIALSTIGFGFSYLNLDWSYDDFFEKVYYFLISMGMTWFFVRFVDGLIDRYLVPLAEKTESDFDDQLLPVVQKGARIIIWIGGSIVALNNAGYDVTTVIAGMGIGGLAFALAAKETISNVFGGFTVFTDKPFRIHDRIKIHGFDGEVIEIGLRSTRLRTLDKRIVTIPNYVFSSELVENVSLEPARKVILKLGLTYDTAPEQMTKALNVLSDIHSNLPELGDDKNIAFTDFGDFSLGITFIYYIKKEADILQAQSHLNLEILKKFNENGLEMAFPTQTIYTKKA